MINLHERMLLTSAGVEPATSWSPVGRRIQLSHQGRLHWAHMSEGMFSLIVAHLQKRIYLFESCSCLMTWNVFFSSIISESTMCWMYGKAASNTIIGVYQERPSLLQCYPHLLRYYLLYNTDLTSYINMFLNGMKIHLLAERYSFLVSHTHQPQCSYNYICPYNDNYSCSR